MLLIIQPSGILGIMVRQNYSYKKADRKSKKWIFIVLALLLAGGFVFWFMFRNEKPRLPDNPQQNNNQAQQPEEPAYEPVDLQPVIDSWTTKYRADYHIAVYDLQASKTIGENNPDTVLFAASLYKLYVAYLTLVDFQTGAQDPNEILIAGQTKRECVDKMIRSSDSPCGEAMMAEIGQLRLNERVKSELGTSGTFFDGIRTNANDIILVLRAIAERKHLNEENAAFLLDAMRTQEARYKRGLQTGAPDAIWETKVGWNLDINYHDVGMMTLQDGRKFAIAILGQGSGSPAPIADFAKTIYDTLAQ